MIERISKYYPDSSRDAHAPDAEIGDCGEHRITMKYGFGKTVRMGFEDAIDVVTEALKTEGFGVLTDIDVQARRGHAPLSNFRRLQPVVGAPSARGGAADWIVTAMQRRGQAGGQWRRARRVHGPGSRLGARG